MKHDKRDVFTSIDMFKLNSPYLILGITLFRGPTLLSPLTKFDETLIRCIWNEYYYAI